MHEFVEEMNQWADKLEEAARKLKPAQFDAIFARAKKAVETFEPSWSGSSLGYHSRMYIRNFVPRGPMEKFEVYWGGEPSGADWVEYSPMLVAEKVRQSKKVRPQDWKVLQDFADQTNKAFCDAQADMVTTLAAILSKHEDETIWRARRTIHAIASHEEAQQIFESEPQAPIHCDDDRAAREGYAMPQHRALLYRFKELQSYALGATDLAKEARKVASYLQKRERLTVPTSVPPPASTGDRIFIGHGRSSDWVLLKDFLQDRLKLEWDEFNRESTAGKSTKERLEEMLNASRFAFLVMTAENETSDGNKQARANVIHEVGLFQGRLGFERAIVLFEDGCEEFSNIVGLTQIRFPKGNIGASFEEIRKVLEREKIISP